MGCFNMSCAITNTPITIWDPVVVAVAAEADQMRTVILPMFFKANYNDYGTVEDYDESDPNLQWFMKFVDKTPRYGIDECIRDLINGGSDDVEFNIKDVSIDRPRAILIHEHAWNKIIHFKKYACDSSYFYHNPRETQHPKDVILDRFCSNERLNLLKSKDNLSDDELDEYKALEFANFVKSIGSSSPEFLRGSISEKSETFRNDKQWSAEEAAEYFGNLFESASLFTSFANEVNSHLITRYASQDTNDNEQELLISLMQERMELLKLKYEE